MVIIRLSTRNVTASAKSVITLRLTVSYAVGTLGGSLERGRLRSRQYW